ncbi:MAG: RNA polymerase sigma-70 factor [Bacteroidales bacterium]|nr:RNA polymerase sigma-70 factor [Bacteroidales bacterium]
MKDTDTSEEIVQEVMFKIWVNRNSLQITGPIRNYLMRAVRNSCLNFLKHLDVCKDHRAWYETMDKESGPSPEEIMIVSELEQKIRNAIDDLPLERRKIFILNRYDRLSYTEIAEKLDISIKTVENQMGKALKTLRNDLSEYLPLIVLFFFDIFSN